MATVDWTKDPDATLDWLFNWGEWLAANESITASTMTVSPGLTLSSSTFGTTTATAWVSGGTTGQPYTLANRITTNQGRTDERTITIRVVQR